MIERSSLADALRSARDELGALGQRFALVGGLAMAARGSTRPTEDVDVAVAVADEAAAQRLISALRGRHPVELLIIKRIDRVGAVRVGLCRGVPVDLMLAHSGVEAEIVAAAQPLQVFPGLTVPVAQVGHLLALKLLARDDRQRPQDAADLRFLRGLALLDKREITRARLAILLCQQRGFHRSKDLGQDLDSLLRGPA